jgi:hypothetical protein
MTRLFDSVGLRITRRWLMKAAAGASLASMWSTPADAARAGAALRRVFSRPESARIVGLAVLRQRAGPIAAEDVLAELRTHRPEICQASGVVSRGRLASMVREARRDDFRRGCACIVDGWLLSRTEALVCAVIALA